MSKTVKGCNIHSVAKIQKNEGPFGDMAKCSKKMRIFKSRSAEKSEKRDLLEFFNIRSIAKYQKIEGQSCKKIGAYARVQTRTLWVEKQASYH